MSLWTTLARPFQRQQRQPAPPPRADASVMGSGSPTYATSISTSTFVPREQVFTLVDQAYRSVPIMARTVEILAGFVGVPQFLIDGNEAATEELNAWAEEVAFGYVGRGLKPFLRDHLGQALLYGYGIGEAVPNTERNDVERLWSYLSPAFGFRTDATGAIQVVQSTGIGGEKVLDPLTTVHTVYNPHGANPNGRGLFFSSTNFTQTWLDISYAFRHTWRRNGVPFFHVHVKLPEGVNDPDGSILASIRSDFETAWNDRMKSAVIDGIAKDFFTVSTADVSVSAVGVEAETIDIQTSKRAIVEEVVSATGIPAWMFGYAWSTTERLSTQQADMLLTTVDCLRAMMEGSLRKIVDLRQRLAAKRGAIVYEIIWPDINLQDLKDTAEAALKDAQAQIGREKYALALWRAGVWDQAMYAEYLTGEPDVAVPMDEPPSAMPETAPEGAESGGDERAQQEGRSEYPELWAKAAVGCNGRH